MLKNKVLAITGGTGSFGSSVLASFLDTDIEEIRIFSRDEKKQEDMRLNYQNPKLKFYIGDVRDYKSIYNALKGVDYVFHAAALKQVPSCEFYPMEAIKTNILGSENVINASLARNVKKLIMLSTDKAVYPINTMGLSKAMMEKLVSSNARSLKENETILSLTRYGNVMFSRGSVIPLFVNQIINDDPVTITDPNMTRFLMNLDDSVALVKYAFENANQGDIFIHKAKSTTIQNLVTALGEIFNKKLNLKIIGTRHGEKLYETLISREEMVRVDDLGSFYRIPIDNRNLNYSLFFSNGEQEISNQNDYTSHNVEILNVEETKDLLLKQKEIKEYLNV